MIENQMKEQIKIIIELYKKGKGKVIQKEIDKGKTRKIMQKETDIGNDKRKVQKVI